MKPRYKLHFFVTHHYLASKILIINNNLNLCDQNDHPAARGRHCRHAGQAQGVPPQVHRAVPLNPERSSSTLSAQLTCTQLNGSYFGLMPAKTCII